MPLGNRILWAGAAACPVAALLAGMLLYRQPKPLAFELVSAQHVEVGGAPESRPIARFRFRNVSDRPIEPTVVWTDCGCNQFSVVPREVQPGEVFVLSAETVVPLFGSKLMRAFRVGTRGSPLSRTILVSATAINDSGRSLAIAPSSVRVRLDDEGRAVLILDIAYDSPLAKGVPELDLTASLEGGTTQIVTEEVVRRVGQSGEFAGQIRVQLQFDDPSEGQRALVVECVGVPAHPIELAIQ